MQKGSSKVSVIAAIAANVSIGIVKFIAAGITASAAMMSEGIHSLVDSGNGILVLYGMKKADKTADREHPFGYGKELYFWTLVVSILIFAIGGGMSISHGYEALMESAAGKHMFRDLTVNYVILVIAMAIEGASLAIAVKQFNAARRKKNMKAMEYIRESKDPSLFTVVLEDTAAEAGLSYHFTITDSYGNETVIPSYGLATTISDLDGKALNIILDGLTEAPPVSMSLTFSVNVSFAGLGNVVTNSGNQLSFNYIDTTIVIDTTVPGDPDATPVATVTPTAVTSGGLEYPAYDIDYTAPAQTGWNTFDATLNGTFCFKFTLQKSITIESGGYSYSVSSGTNYYSFVNGVAYSSTTLEGITWMSSSEPITFTIHKHDADAGAFMTVIYPQP
jgi:uncharacterized membrane protein